jgi:serine/threonine protein kinase
MTPERWQQIRGVYEQAAALELPQRFSYLDSICGADQELRREVESLLSYEERAGSSFLGTSAADFLKAGLEVKPVASRIGRKVGVYQVMEEIGHGGMGEVYRAARVDGQYEKEVAIKLVRSGYDSSLIVERFRHERQILATLDHPNIARLLDGSTTEDGIPYLVMELIDGTPIDQYCDGRKLPVPERLAVFRQVCDAVHYAHQRLVIHRDLKPSNILVTGDGVPKLLDFGIAKILDPSAGPEATLLNPLTPEYASPEQLRGQPITTASDVYSLGVVLYRLLTGRSPYRVERRSPADLARAITETEAERPSVAVAAMGDDAPGIHNESPAKLSRRLRGDLDSIVLKALRKEAQRRYSSVEQLSEDVRRHMERLPVQARKGSWNYRAGKFLRRHKIGMTAAVLVVLAVAGGVAATVREARVAAANAARAEKRFHDVRKLANSLIFEIHDSIQKLPGATPSRKLLLDRAVEYLDRLSQDANGDVDLQRELAWAYQRLATVQGDTTQSNLGHISAAEESHRKSMALFEAIAKANPHNLNDQLNLAMAYRMRAFFDIYVPSGRGEIDRALAVTDPLMQSDGDKIEVKNERAQEYLILASIQDAVGDRFDAIDTYKKLLDLQRQILRTQPDYPRIRQSTAKAMVLLAHQVGRFGSRDEALALMKEGLTEYEALAKATADPGVVRDLAASLGRRGEIELMNNDIAAAASDFRRSKELLTRLAKLDPENQMLQSDVWVAEFQAGKALALGGNYEKALGVLQRAFQGYEDLHLEDDVGPGPGAMQAWIGEAQAAAHMYAKALTSYGQAAEKLAKDETSYDDARCDLAVLQTKLASTLLTMGKIPQAEAEYRKALDTAKVSASLAHKDIPALYAAADAYAGMGDVARARAAQTKNAASRSALLNEARVWYEKGASMWEHIPYASKISGNGYAAMVDKKEIALRLAHLPKP